MESVDRPLGSTENIYWLLDRLYCLNFVVYAQLEGALPQRALAKALATVQDEHPLLRARIEVADGRAWFRPVARRLAPIVAQRLALAGWRRAIERQLQRPFAAGTAPLARFLHFRGPGAKSVAAMVFHHAIADGRSGTTVLLDVLRRATHLPAPPDYRRAHPSSQSLDLIHAKSPVLSVLQEARFWWAKGKDALRFARQLPDYDATPSAAPDIRIIAFSLPRAATASLAATARLRGTTMQGALGAAQLLALNDEFAARAPRPLALNSLADLRGVLAGNLTERDLGLYVTTLCTVHALPEDPDFWSLAREVRDALAATIESGDANLINGVYPANPLLEPGEDVARLVQRVVALAPPSSMLTNIGRVGVVDLGARCRIRELAFAVSPPAQHPICVTSATYEGALSLNLLHDRNKLPAARAKAIGQRLVARLEAAAT
jgi:NRPS condensation-like uncharacterized protein